MKYFFQKSKKPEMQISGDDLSIIAVEACDTALVRANRPMYSLIDEDELAQWLFATKVDRIPWREAGKGIAEFVCVDFSLLLWALMEQERARQGVPYPFAFARTILASHSSNAVVTDRRLLKTVEPQTDEIALVLDMQFNSIDFV